MTNKNTQRRGSSAHMGAMNQSPNPANERLLKFLQTSPEVQAEIDLVLEGRPPDPHNAVCSYACPR